MVGTSSLENLGYAARIFMAGYVHNRAFQYFEYVWTEDCSSTNSLISARNLIPFCRLYIVNATHHTDSFSSDWKVCFPTGGLAGIYFAVRLTYQLV